jgi:hypothetical protein
MKVKLMNEDEDIKVASTEANENVGSMSEITKPYTLDTSVKQV